MFPYRPRLASHVTSFLIGGPTIRQCYINEFKAASLKLLLAALRKL
jgi:hypothetical protein